MTSVQPDNRSALQQAIEEALVQELGVIEMQAPFPGVLDAQVTPVQLLPSLAIERGVSDWSVDDSEKGRRDTVAQGLRLNSLSCSHAGIAGAIGSLGFLADVKRVRPYVLSVVVNLDEQPLSDAMATRLVRRANTYKAARDSLDLSLSRTVEGEISVAGALQVGTVLTIHPYVPEDVNVSGPLFVGSALHSVQILTIHPGEA